MGLADKLEDIIIKSGELCGECDQCSNWRDVTWCEGKVRIDCCPTMNLKDTQPFKRCNRKFPKSEKNIQKFLIELDILKE